MPFTHLIILNDDPLILSGCMSRFRMSQDHGFAVDAIIGCTSLDELKQHLQQAPDRHTYLMLLDIHLESSNLAADDIQKLLNATHTQLHQYAIFSALHAAELQRLADKIGIRHAWTIPISENDWLQLFHKIRALNHLLSHLKR